MMNNAIVNQATCLNNTGVQFLMNGHYEKSIQSFGLSVKALKAELRSRTQQKDKSNSCSNVPLQARNYNLSSAKHTFSLAKVELPSLQQQQLQPQTTTSGTKRRLQYDDDGSSSFLFSQAFQIPNEISIDETEQEPQQQHLLSTTEVFIYCSQVIYNLALAHQCLAMKISIIQQQQQQQQRQQHHPNKFQHQQQQKQMLMEKSINLYKAARAILEKESCLTSCTGWIVQLACVTNSSEVVRSLSNVSSPLSPFNDFENYHRTCEALRYLSTHCDEVFQDPRLEGLLTHVLCLNSPTLAPAA